MIKKFNRCLFFGYMLIVLVISFLLKVCINFVFKIIENFDNNFIYFGSSFEIFKIVIVLFGVIIDGGWN